MSADLSLFTVVATDTIRTAMERITANKLRAVVVVDDDRRVLGVVSDGDIRRAFLHDVLAIAPVSQIMQINPRVTSERSATKRHEQAVHDKVTLLPIVDDDYRLVGVEAGYEPFAD
jgi:CBS domain-containing protein